MDSGIQSNQQVSPFYDPMLAKVIAYGANRDEARRRLMGSLKKLTLLGVRSNRGFLFNILNHPVFAAGDATTAFIEKDFGGDKTLTPHAISSAQQAVAAWLFYLRSGLQNRQAAERAFWRNSNPAPTWYDLEQVGERFSVAVKVLDAQNQSFEVLVGDERIDLALESMDDRLLSFSTGGVSKQIQYAFNADGVLFLETHEGCAAIEDKTHAPVSSAQGQGSGQIKASMDGAIIDVLIEEGTKVEKGQTLVILEAMKMEHAMKADMDGVVKTILVAKGDQVKGRQLLVEVAGENPETEPA